MVQRPAEVRWPDVSAGNVTIYKPEKPRRSSEKPPPPVPLTLDALQLGQPSRKRKGQRRKGAKAQRLTLEEPPPVEEKEPSPSLPAPLPLNPYELSQELEEGEKGLSRLRKLQEDLTDDLPWRPSPDGEQGGAGKSARQRGRVPDVLRRKLTAVIPQAAGQAVDWLRGRVDALRTLVATALPFLLARLPQIPRLRRSRKVRRYRGGLRLPAWRQWRSFGVASLLTGFAVTAAVEAVRTGSFVSMCAWAGERMGSFLLSGLLYGGVIAFLGALAGRLWASGLLVSVVALAAALVNYLKLRIDGTPLILSDFGLIGQAGDVAGVAGELNPPDVFWRSVWFLTFCILALFFIQHWTRVRGPDRLTPIVASFALTVILFSAGLAAPVGAVFGVNVVDRLPPATNHRLYGLTVSLWRELFLQKISPPHDYSPEQMRDVLNEIDALAPEIDAVPETMPNVIVILSESFFDPTRLSGVTYDRDPVKNFHDLQAESISGHFFSHYLGYGTGYIEMSMQSGIGELDLDAGTNICFMPDETYDLLDALAEQYTNLGTYTAEMLHAYDNSLYNRTVTYPRMGYSKSLYSEDIRSLGLEWNESVYGGYYMKDSYFMQALRHEMEAINETGQRAFLYGITMENHQPFNPDKFNGVSQVKVTAPKLKRSELEILKVGVEGIVRADKALRELTDALREYPVPTIVAFYGDHRPTLPMPNGRTVYTQLGLVPGGDTSLWTVEQIGDIYSSDYLIWANDAALLQGQAGTRKASGVLSFGPMILELTGQPVSRWWSLACLSAKVQLTSREVYFVNADGVPFFTQAEAGLSEAEEHLLYLRSCVLYDAIYGKRYITKEMNRLPRQSGP